MTGRWGGLKHEEVLVAEHEGQPPCLAIISRVKACMMTSSTSSVAPTSAVTSGILHGERVIFAWKK